MWYSPGRYPGWVCSARSASRKASPWPGFTRKNRLNSLVEPTLTPGRGAPVAVVAILPPMDQTRVPKRHSTFKSSASAASFDLPPAAATTYASLTRVRLDATVVSSPGERPHLLRMISCLAGAHDRWPAESRECAKPADADPVGTAAAPRRPPDLPLALTPPAPDHHAQ